MRFALGTPAPPKKFRAVEAKDRSGQPILDANGKPTFNQVPVGDIDKFMEIAAALSLTSFRLARFQSPTLQAIAVPQQQAQSSQPIHFKVHIRNAEGEHAIKLLATIKLRVAIWTGSGRSPQG